MVGGQWLFSCPNHSPCPHFTLSFRINFKSRPARSGVVWCNFIPFCNLVNPHITWIVIKALQKQEQNILIAQSLSMVIVFSKFWIWILESGITRKICQEHDSLWWCFKCVWASFIYLVFDLGLWMEHILDFALVVGCQENGGNDGI